MSRLYQRAIVVGALLLAGCPHNEAPPQTGPETTGPGPAALTAAQMEEVNATVRAGEPTIERCYTEELERRNDKSFKGRVVVKIEVGTSRNAAQVQIGESTLNAKNVHDCIINVVKSWEFPALPKSAWFTYPYNFQPAY